MYKVFFVEDEIVVREGIKNIDWESTEFVYAGDAPDGEMALPLINEIKPDIVVTDIKMPFLDGLALSKIIKNTLPDTKIVILSGHDEFSYAKEAISIGVTDYLLKPISADDLICALKKVAKVIDKEKDEKMKLEGIKMEFELNIDFLRNKFLADLVKGTIDSYNAIENAKNYNIDIIAKHFIVIVLELDPTAYIGNSEYAEVESVVNQIQKEYDISFWRDFDQLVVIAKGDDLQSLKAHVKEFCETLKKRLDEKINYNYSILIGKVANRIADIKKSYQSAIKAKNFKYLHGKKSIIYAENQENETDTINIMKYDRDTVYEFLLSGDVNYIKTFLDNYFKQIDPENLKSFMYRHYIFVDILITVAKFAEKLGENPENIIPEISSIDKFLAENDTLESLLQYTHDAIKKVILCRDSVKGKKYASFILKAKEYINANFQNEDFSLSDTAAQVNVSPSHFSAIFSQETGETFSEYLTKVRIKKACELLKCTDLKSSEIAYKVGYKDPHYFSFIFKKQMGMTPKEYRQNYKG